MHVITDTTSFLIVLVVAAVAPLVAAGANRLVPSVIVPIAVVELVLGAIVGPHAFRAAHSDDTLNLLQTLGLGFLFVRGLPVMLLYRGELPRRDRISLSLLCATQLPLVVAITDLGVAQGQMRPSTAVALVTAGVLSVLVFPSLALAPGRGVGAAEPVPGPGAVASSLEPA